MFNLLTVSVQQVKGMYVEWKCMHEDNSNTFMKTESNRL